MLISRNCIWFLHLSVFFEISFSMLMLLNYCIIPLSTLNIFILATVSSISEILGVKLFSSKQVQGCKLALCCKFMFFWALSVLILQEFAVGASLRDQVRFFSKGTLGHYQLSSTWSQYLHLGLFKLCYYDKLAVTNF